MKKLTVTMLVLMSVFVCTACSKSDVKIIEKKGYFVCGVTYYSPMNYFDNEEFVGFDTELAQAVASELGLQVKFQLINWDAKFLELNSGNIDCIWNGFTIDEERKKNVDCSKPYLNNSQCIVVRAEDVALCPNKEFFIGKKVAAEAGSPGAYIAKEYSGLSTYINVDAQMKALIEVNSRTVDFAVVDFTLATANVGKGDYASLAIIDNKIAYIEPEEYVVGFRKDSDFTSKVDKVLVKLSQSGKITEIAAKYGLSNAVIDIK